MKFHYFLFSLALCQLEGGHAFNPTAARNSLVSSTVLHAKSRKAKKMQNVERETRGRSKQFYDAIEDAQGKSKDKPEEDGASPPDADEARRQAITEDAQSRMEARPELSTMMVDEETGIEVIAQGQSVLDVVTRKAVKLSDKGLNIGWLKCFLGSPLMFAKSTG